MNENTNPDIIEKQIGAILDLSKQDNYADNMTLSIGNNDTYIGINIDHNRVKRIINWSRIGNYIAITIFILSIFLLQDPISINIFNGISLWGLMVIIFADKASKFKGGLFAWPVLITKPSPISMVKFVGWLLLLIPTISEIIHRI